MLNKTLTILFADVQGFTSRTGSQGREENVLFVREIRDFVEKHVRENNGVFVKAMGDGFLATFESPTDAVTAGTRIQKQIEQRNANILDESRFIRFRIGISTGEVTVDESGDVFGDAVNIAARIQSFAEPNEVFISDATYLSMNKAEIKALDLGPQRFKNVLQEVRVYRVLKGLEAARPGPVGVADVRPPERGFPVAYVALAALAVALVGMTIFFAARSRSPAAAGYPPPPGYGGAVGGPPAMIGRERGPLAPGQPGYGPPPPRPGERMPPGGPPPGPGGERPLPPR